MAPRSAPTSSLSEFVRDTFHDSDYSFEVYRAGKGPAVIVLTEIPGISPQVLGFAARVAAEGFSVVLPDLFGEAGRDPLSPDLLANGLYAVQSVASACINREFTVLAAGKTSPMVARLRRLAAVEHARCGGPGVGVVGMCFTGGFALAMAVDPRVVAPVLSQPSLPLPVLPGFAASIDCDPAELDVVARRCARDGLTVLGLRFRGDPLVPEARFQFLRQKLGDGFVSVEIDQVDGHPNGPLPRHHSVLTTDLIDEPGEPTRAGLDKVLELFRARLLTPDVSARGVSADN